MAHKFQGIWLHANQLLKASMFAFLLHSCSLDMLYRSVKALLIRSDLLVGFYLYETVVLFTFVLC